MKKQNSDEYEILSEVGSGGMATVYKAVQKSLGRVVAIKELKKEFLGDDRIVKRFEREAQTAASFQHENIAHIYDFRCRPDCSIVMEYVDGISLSEIIVKAGPLPVGIGAMIAIQVCSALDYAHMRGVLHRDIKPGNVMVRRNGEVKLMDFGIAQVRTLESLTMPGTLMGTPSYMSPEQALGDTLDPRSDIFSLGIVLYEMFTGLKPFVDQETRSVTAKIIGSKYLPPRRLNSEIPRRLQRIIKKCLKKKPSRRYGSVQEVAGALGKLVRGRTDKSASLMYISEYLIRENLVVRAPEEDTIVPARDSFGMGRYGKIIVAGAVLLLVLIGAAGYYFRTAARPAARPAPQGPSVPGSPGAANSEPVLTQPLTPPSPAPSR